MVLSVCPEHVGSLQQLLETQVLEDGLANEEVQLGLITSAQVKLHQHVTTALTITTLQEMLP